MNRKRVLRFAPLLALFTVLLAVQFSGVGRYFSLAELQRQEATLRGFIEAHEVLGVLAFVLLYMAVAALSIPGALVLTLAGGFLFGIWLGGMATVVGATLGAVILFFAVRTSLGASLRVRAERSGGPLRSIMEGLRAGAFGYILTLRLAPVAPFWLVNVAAGLADAPLRPYVLATFLGIMPATFIYSGVGAGIGRIVAQGGEPNLGVILEPLVLGPLVALALLSLGVTLFQRWRASRRRAT